MTLARRRRHRSASAILWRVSLLVLFAGLAAPPENAVAQAVRTNPGFAANSVPRNDDGSTSTAIDLGFTVNFFGATFSSAWVNNNGNITFGGPLGTFTPEGLIASPLRIIAPFWADVDTRAAGSALVTYGKDVVNGRAAFGVNWVNVGYFGNHDDKLNSFQLVLIDRSDIAPGNFDIEFNYDRIVWETGDASGGRGGLGGTSASAGYSNGTGKAESSFEILGSRQPGLFLDSNRNALIRRRLNSTLRGRLVFFVRSGAVECTYSILSTTLEFPWPGGTGVVQVAAPGGCEWTASSGAAFVTITSGATGNGSGNVEFTVAENRGTRLRTATLTIAGQTVVLTQDPFITLRANPPVLNLSSVGGVFPSRVALRLESLSGTIDWFATVALLNGDDWNLKVTPSSGTITETQPGIIILEVNRGFVPPLSGTAAITIRDLTNGPVAVVPVTLNVSPSAGNLQLSQTAFLFRAPEGSAAPLTQTLTLLNSGQGQLSWSIPASAINGASWLSLSSLAGLALADANALSTTTLTANPTGLPPGIYQVLLPVSSPEATNDPQLVTVTLEVTPAGTVPVPEVSPSGLIFVAQPGQTSLPSQSISIRNLGSGDLTFRLDIGTEAGGNWLDVSTVTGSAGTAPTDVQVTATPAGLAPGFYRGAIFAGFSAGKAQQVQVVLVVPEVRRTLLGASLCSPIGMDLVTTTVGEGTSLRVSAPTTLAAHLVDTCGRPVNDATVLFQIGKTTIPLPPAGDGIYRAIWTPELEGDSQSVSFTALHGTFAGLQRSFTVTIAPPAAAVVPTISLGGIVDAAGFIPGLPLAPGEIISIFGAGFATEEAVATTLPLPRQLAGARVLIGNEDAPLFYAGPAQINAQVPFTVTPGAIVPVVVSTGGLFTAPQNFLIVAAQPAIFQSEGSVVALDSRSQLITPQNPARLGDTIQIFATGLGLTDPAVASGAAAPATSTLRTPARVKVGGVEVPVTYQGLAPGTVGLYQINAVLPPVVAPGDAVPVVILQNGISSELSSVVAIPVRRP